VSSLVTGVSIGISPIVAVCGGPRTGPSLDETGQERGNNRNPSSRVILRRQRASVHLKNADTYGETPDAPTGTRAGDHRGRGSRRLEVSRLAPDDVLDSHTWAMYEEP
jgi:hypothetical protein